MKGQPNPTSFVAFFNHIIIFLGRISYFPTTKGSLLRSLLGFFLIPKAVGWFLTSPLFLVLSPTFSPLLHYFSLFSHLFRQVSTSLFYSDIIFWKSLVCTLKHLINNAIEYSLDDDFLLGRSPLAYNISFNIVVSET